MSFPVSYPADTGMSLILAVAFVVDALVGDPKWIYTRVPHPVALLGRLINQFDTALNSPRATETSRRISGVLVVMIVVCASGLIGWGIAWGLRSLEFAQAWIGEAIIVAVLIAYRDLYDHVKRVADGLDIGIVEGRSAVSQIVGRDPESLDEAGVARAAIESTAENFSDGVVAPILFYVLFGLPGICAYKAINTLDSMIGHKNERYGSFGWAAARLDDLFNLPAARLAGAIFVLAAWFVTGARMIEALKSMFRDASKHRSPNAGWPEAAVAGALGLALAGPRRYGEDHVDDPWMGAGRQDATSADIRRGLRLYVMAGGITVTLGFLALHI